MSERGSFVTEYIYCSECMKSAARVLCADDTEISDVPFKSLWAITLPSWEGDKKLPIIAGRVGSSYAGGELIDFELDYVPKLERSLCHTLRIAVLAEDGEQIFTIDPKGIPS